MPPIYRSKPTEPLGTHRDWVKSGLGDL